MVLLAGGAFQARGNYTDTLPTAAHLRELGYQTFIVDYRLRPYTQEEGALDVVRARTVYSQKRRYLRIDPNDIAVMGYSAAAFRPGNFSFTMTRMFCQPPWTRIIFPMNWTKFLPMPLPAE